MKEFVLLRGIQERASKTFHRATTYAQELREFLGNLNAPGEHRDSLKRAVLYPAIWAGMGVVGSWALWEASYLPLHLGVLTLNSISHQESPIFDIGSYFNNPFRNIFMPEIPPFTGKVMAVLGAIKALTEEHTGLKPDYRALMDGRQTKISRS